MKPPVRNDPEERRALALQAQRLRASGPAARFQAARALSLQVARMAFAALARARPGLRDRELRAAFVELVHGNRAAAGPGLPGER
jgi:hypothetical protein